MSQAKSKTGGEAESDLGAAEAAEIETEEFLAADAPLVSMKSAREQAAESGISQKQRLDFKTAVDLDGLRKTEERMGLQALYVAWCENGNSKWLNPSKELGRIRENCQLFRGPVSAMRPLVRVLLHLTKNGVSPHAFLRYVALPRMGDDFDWRNWPTRHFTALSIIADLIIEIKQSAPFDADVMGSGNFRMARDIVVVKFFAQPLAFLPERELQIQDYRDTYKEIWKGFYLDNSLHIYFLKRNVLPVLFRYAHRLGFNQLIQILHNIPQIENGFRTFYPDDRATQKINDLRIHLYHRDFLRSIEDRERREFSVTHIAQELRAYVRIVAALLRARSGIYLCEFFATELRKRKDPLIADLLLRLVNILRDDGGMHIFRWHVERMLALSKSEMQVFLNEIEANHGRHPNYRGLARIFNYHTDTVKKDKLKAAAVSLGVWDDSLQKAYVLDEFSERTLLRHYLQLKPEHARLIEQVRSDIAHGTENRWQDEQIRVADALPVELFPLIMKSTIPALNTAYSSGMTHNSFGDLFSMRDELPKALSGEIHHTFSINTFSPELADRLAEDKVRMQINIDLIAGVFEAIVNPDFSDATNLIMILNKMQREMDDRMRARKADARGTLQVPEGMKQRHDMLRNIMAVYERASRTEQYVLLMLVTAHLKKPPEITGVAIRETLKRYMDSHNLRQKFEMLRIDVATGALQPHQLERIIRVCEDIIAAIISDPELNQLFVRDVRRNSEFEELCLVLTRINSNVLTVHHIDAAAKWLLKVNALNAERGRWLKLIVAEQQVKANPVRYHMRLTKSPLDFYFGHMGGICLASHGAEILKEDFHVVRLSNLETQEIVGIALAVLEREKPATAGPRRWLGFAVNMIQSFGSKLTANEQLLVYMHFRFVYEKLALQTKRPVVLAGNSDRMILSNDSTFRSLILKLERRRAQRTSAYMSTLVYESEAFDDGLLIINPQAPQTLLAHAFFKVRRGERD
jgi:hypothetical protein